jgi:transcriptional regulator with XRE-family HTH domain
VYLPEIGTRLKQLRSQRNISQIDLARQLGVSKSVISSYENEIHLPPYDVLIKMARMFGVSTDYLLGAGGNRSINVDGLTDRQIEAVTMIVEELRTTNNIRG